MARNLLSIIFILFYSTTIFANSEISKPSSHRQSFFILLVSTFLSIFLLSFFLRRSGIKGFFDKESKRRRKAYQEYLDKIARLMDKSRSLALSAKNVSDEIVKSELEKSCAEIKSEVSALLNKNPILLAKESEGPVKVENLLHPLDFDTFMKCANSNHSKLRPKHSFKKVS